MHGRSGRVFSGSGIWPKYGAGFGKTRDVLTGKGILQLLAKIQARRGICLPVRWEFGKSYVCAAEWNRCSVFFFRLLLFFFLERKAEFAEAMKNIAWCIRDFREKNTGNTGSDPASSPRHILKRGQIKAKQTRFVFFRRAKTRAKHARSPRYARQE